MHIHDEDSTSRYAYSHVWRLLTSGGGMKKWGADFGIPEVVVRDYPKQPTIVDFGLVLATRLIERHKYA